MKKNILRTGTGVKKRHVWSLQAGYEEKSAKEENAIPAHYLGFSMLHFLSRKVKRREKEEGTNRKIEAEWKF